MIESSRKRPSGRMSTRDPAHSECRPNGGEDGVPAGHSGHGGETRRGRPSPSARPGMRRTGSAAARPRRRPAGRPDPARHAVCQPLSGFGDAAEGTPRGDDARKFIRKRLRASDSVPPAPGGYGTPGNRESSRYFPSGGNRVVAESERCPFEVNGTGKEEV